METKVNSGAIFKNDFKTADNQPDYRGKINVNGKEWEIALWVKGTQQAGKYFSASIKEPWVKPEESVPTANEDDDLPF